MTIVACRLVEHAYKPSSSEFASVYNVATAWQFSILGQFPGKKRLHTGFKCSISCGIVSDGGSREMPPREQKAKEAKRYV